MFPGLIHETLRPLVDTLVLSIKTDQYVRVHSSRLGVKNYNLFLVLQEVSLPRRLERWRSRCGRSGDEDGFDKTSRRRSWTEPRTRDDSKRELKKKSLNAGSNLTALTVTPWSSFILFSEALASPI